MSSKFVGTSAGVCCGKVDTHINCLLAEVEKEGADPCLFLCSHSEHQDIGAAQLVNHEAKYAG